MYYIKLYDWQFFVHTFQMYVHRNNLSDSKLSLVRLL